jgi:hypothetical protein
VKEYGEYAAQTALNGPAVSREPQVSRELDVLAKEIAQLQERVEGLAGRLVPILNQRPPNPGKDTVEPMPKRVPLAAAIVDQTQRVRSIAARIQTLLEEIEL